MENSKCLILLAFVPLQCLAAQSGATTKSDEVTILTNAWARPEQCSPKNAEHVEIEYLLAHLQTYH